MACQPHTDHDCQHGPDCAHTGVRHEGHVDYLHDGHMHHVHGDHVDEHSIGVSDQNPHGCRGGHDCDAHADGHQHGPECGHEAVPHGDHADYLVDGHLHHVCGDGHCDDHGVVEVV
jgi:hypothetical protein